MLVNELSDYISKYLSSGRHRNLNRLSRETGVPYITLRRISFKEVQSVSFENSIAIIKCCGITSAKEIVAFVDRWFPHTAALIKTLNQELLSEDFHLAIDQEITSSSTGLIDRLEASLKEAIHLWAQNTKPTEVIKKHFMGDLKAMGS
jgi:hypothetical protein